MCGERGHGVSEWLYRMNRTHPLAIGQCVKCGAIVVAVLGRQSKAHQCAVPDVLDYGQHSTDVEFIDRALEAFSKGRLVPLLNESLVFSQKMIQSWRQEIQTAGERAVRDVEEARRREEREKARTTVEQRVAPVEGGFVYLVSDGKALKIGKTRRHPEVRLRELNCGSGSDLELIGAFYVADADDAERQLHDGFEHLRVRGEWFMDSAEIRALFPRAT